MFVAVLLLTVLPQLSFADDGQYTQSISLKSGWNLVSTPRVLDSHVFSLPENSDNFDIYVLSPDNPSKWATMSDLGQTEFQPLYGYFIDNKSSSDQTLTFNYVNDPEISERFFDRLFSSNGWYSIGISNPTYAQKLLGKSTTGSDNNNNILNSLNGKFSSVIDLNDQDKSSVSVGDTWKEAVSSDINNLNIFKELKGYVVYINNINAEYTGFQNNDPVLYGNENDGLTSQSSSNNPDATTIMVDTDNTTDDVLTLAFKLKANTDSSDLNILNIPISVNVDSDTPVENIVNDIYIKVDGQDYEYSDLSDNVYTFSINEGDLVLSGGDTIEIKVYVSFKEADTVDTYNSGESVKFNFVGSGLVVENSYGTQIDTSNVLDKNGNWMTLDSSGMEVSGYKWVVNTTGTIVDFFFTVEATGDEDVTVLASGVTGEDINGTAAGLLDAVSPSATEAATTLGGVLTRSRGDTVSNVTHIGNLTGYKDSAGDKTTFRVRYSLNATSGDNGKWAEVMLESVAGQTIPTDDQTSTTATISL